MTMTTMRTTSRRANARAAAREPPACRVTHRASMRRRTPTQPNSIAIALPFQFSCLLCAGRAERVYRS